MSRSTWCITTSCWTGRRKRPRRREQSTALQRLAIPFRQIGGGFVGVLQEAEQQRVGIAGEAHRLVRQDELPEVLVVVRGRGAQRRVAVTFRLRIGIDV